MTKEKAFDMQSAAQAAGVKSKVFTDDRKASVQYGIVLYKVEDLYRIGRELDRDEGPQEVAVGVDQGRSEILIT